MIFFGNQLHIHKGRVLPVAEIIYVRRQCSKLGFQFVQTLGAEGGKCVYPEFNLSAHKLRYTLNIKQHGAHARCTAF